MNQIRLPRNPFAKAAALLFSLCMIAGCSGCGNKTVGTSPPQDGAPDSSESTPDAPGSSQATGEKMASSLSDYIDQRMNDPNNTAGDRAKLEQIKQDGGVTLQQYESAWSDYKECMADKGYKQIILTKFPNGLYMEAMHKTGTSAQEQQYGEDQDYCQNQHTRVVSMIYEVMQGNPTFLSNQSEAIVDCLHRNDLVPKDYTVEDYGKDQSAEKPEYDRNDMGVRSCQLANSSYVSLQDDPVEQLW
jgi:hypothetical protein